MGLAAVVLTVICLDDAQLLDLIIGGLPLLKSGSVLLKVVEEVHCPFV